MPCREEGSSPATQRLLGGDGKRDGAPLVSLTARLPGGSGVPLLSRGLMAARETHSCRAVCSPSARARMTSLLTARRSTLSATCHLTRVPLSKLAFPDPQTDCIHSLVPRRGLCRSSDALECAHVLGGHPGSPGVASALWRTRGFARLFLALARSCGAWSLISIFPRGQGLF